MIADCVRQCGQDVTCVPQLYQDWHYCTFELDQDHPGVMRMKTLPSETNPTEVTILRAGVAIKDIKEAYQSQVMPPVLSPPVDC